MKKKESVVSRIKITFWVIDAQIKFKHPQLNYYNYND